MYRYIFGDTYLAEEAQPVENSKREKQTEGGSEHCKSVKLCQNHAIHHQAANDHKCEFCCLMGFKEVINSFCPVKEAIFNARNVISYKESAT